MNYEGFPCTSAPLLEAIETGQSRKRAKKPSRFPAKKQMLPDICCFKKTSIRYTVHFSYELMTYKVCAFHIDM